MKKKREILFPFGDEMRLRLRKMKLTVLLTFLVIATFGSGFSQVTLSLHFNQAKIQDVLASIEKKTDYIFMYKDNIVDGSKSISVDFQDAKFEEVLKFICEQANIDYEVRDRQIILKEKTDIPMPSAPQQPQKREISGVIKDAKGLPLPGVSVVVKGTTMGTVTDNDGKFSLSVPVDAQILAFSFVGMKVQEIPIAGTNIIDLVMEEESTSLDEVVAIGYGTVKKSDLTGAMASIKSDALNQGAIISPQQMLQGKIAGVNITMNNGQPGANATVRIRGANSINFSNSPLYVIDGVPVAFAEGNFSGPDRTNVLANNPLNMLNPADIDRIDVLKDASSTAIYGARAANGVIMITTKRGNKGGKIEYETYFGSSQLRKKMPVLDAVQVRSYAAAHANLTFKDGGANVDWQNEIFRNALSQSHAVSFSDGNEKTTFRASLGYLDQKGIIISSGIKNTNANISVNSKFLDNKLIVGFNAIHANELTDNVPSIVGIGGDGNGDVIRDALRANPTLPVKDLNSPYTGGYTFISQFVQNPVEEAMLMQDLMESNRTIGSITASLQITKELVFNTNAGYTLENITKKVYVPLSSRLGSESKGSASNQSRNGSSKLIETTLDYSKVINSNQKFKVLAGYSYQKFENNGSYIQRSNFVEDISGANNISAGSLVNAATSFKDDNTIVSFFGRLNYDLNGKYLMTATIRDDGSSRFGADSKWGLFPSFAGAWKISEEGFLKENKTLTNLKLRLGYGKTGNQAVPNYGSLALVRTSPDLNPEIGITAVPSTIANLKLKWETTSQTNIGLDYGFFEGKISGSVEIYKKKTSDLILSFAIPNPTPVPSRLENVGDVENKGVEFDITGKVIDKGDFHLEVYGNISANRNKVLSLSKGSLITPAFGITSFNALSPQQANQQVLITRVGEPMGAILGYDFIGFDSAGKEQFRDLDNNNIINNLDRKIIGQTQPDFTYGFGINLNWKNFDFSTFFRGVQGIQILNSLRNDLENPVNLPNINTLDAALSNGTALSPGGLVSTRFIENGSYLRCENATLGYNFKSLRIPLVNNVSVYLTGQNLFVFTKYSGFDPEVNVAGYTNYPRPRTILLGLKVQF